jgi:hypothetical protein
VPFWQFGKNVQNHSAVCEKVWSKEPVFGKRLLISKDISNNQAINS